MVVALGIETVLGLVVGSRGALLGAWFAQQSALAGRATAPAVA